MGGKSGGSAAPAPARPATPSDEYIPGTMDPTTGLPFLNPDYVAPEPFAFPEMPDYGAQQSAYADQLADQQAEILRTQGLNDRDSLYSEYMSAAGSATDYINQQITQEQSNARLMGVDYVMDDEMKQTRISNYFASIWGEGDQARLEGLFQEWGDPKGFGGWTLQRGDAGAADVKNEGSEEVVATTGDRTLVDPVEEEETLGSATLLGG